jgi:hypothetical protein
MAHIPGLALLWHGVWCGVGMPWQAKTEHFGVLPEYLLVTGTPPSKLSTVKGTEMDFGVPGFFLPDLVLSCQAKANFLIIS